ncbi:MAG: AAA family ATPase [Synergistaceae bacterium]|jgi:MoxR-like ATPase|nr:AAA family ATPase [Synergistaceae bacterium]
MRIRENKSGEFMSANDGKTIQGQKIFLDEKINALSENLVKLKLMYSENPDQTFGEETLAELIAQTQAAISQLTLQRDQLRNCSDAIGQPQDSELENEEWEEPEGPKLEMSRSLKDAGDTPQNVENAPLPNNCGKGEYLEIGETYIPVVSSRKHKPQWEAIPGKLKISGGRKFSEVTFQKESGSLTITAPPGGKLDFNEYFHWVRLETIDNILEGTAELRAFQDIYRYFKQKSENYERLVVGKDDYEKKAQSLTRELDLITDESNFFTLLSKCVRSRIEDQKGFYERARDIFKTLRFLREKDEQSVGVITPVDRHYKFTPYYRTKLAQFAALINRQLGLGNDVYREKLGESKQPPSASETLPARGMTVVVGPRGTGKNKIVEYYSALANRPLFRYACSPDKEERDLTYDVELQDGEVVRIPTRILTAISTPDAILELDEINLLRPNVAKFFNALFDCDRALFLDDQVIRASDGVVFVGLMNPADYDGVEDLPDTIDDRSNVMTMNYPPLKEVDRRTGQERFTIDEALILKSMVGVLDKISDTQFERVWEAVINGNGYVNVTGDVIKIVKDLKNILAIAERTRKTVEAYKTRYGNTRMERDISLRGTMDAASFYSDNHLWDTDMASLQGWRPPWNAAQYAVASTYLPHTDTYRKGRVDRDALMLILADGIG